ncbi:hypothetical protein KI387_017079, partial [Taxus chinensis]
MNFKDDEFSKLAASEAGPSKKEKDRKSSRVPIKVKIVKKRKERQISSIISPAET